jgi:Fe-S cluster assembly iron-binding protein IscA
MTPPEKIKSADGSRQGISDGGLRVGIKGGGCLRLELPFGWERVPRLGDEVLRESWREDLRRQEELHLLEGDHHSTTTRRSSPEAFVSTIECEAVVWCGSSFGA